MQIKPYEPNKFAGRHTRIVALNLQTSGRRLNQPRPGLDYVHWDEYKPTSTPHRPGVDVDCILEVGVIVLDASSLKEIVRQSWLVLPPGVDTVDKFDAWKAALSEANPFVHDMHSTPQGAQFALLNDLRTLAGATGKPGDPVRWTTNEITQLLHSVSTLNDGDRYMDKGPFFDWGTVSPTNSDLMLLGHDLDGFIIPMLQYWMSDVEQTFSNRKLDVLTFNAFAEIVQKDLDIYFEPGPKNQTHRAQPGCDRAVEALMDLAANAGISRETPESVESEKDEITSVDLHVHLAAQKRVEHLEMLVRYGRRGAIREERKRIEAREREDREASTSAGTSAGSDELLGLFRKTGGILRSKYAEKFEEVEGEDLDGDFNAGFNGGYIGVPR